MRMVSHLGERTARLSLLVYALGMAAVLAWAGVFKLILYILAALVGFLLVAFVLVATLVPLARGAASLLIPLLRPLRPSRSHRGIFPAGVCSQCGYDLRATPERCPECGTVSWRRR